MKRALLIISCMLSVPLVSAQTDTVNKNLSDSTVIVTDSTGTRYRLINGKKSKIVRAPKDLNKTTGEPPKEQQPPVRRDEGERKEE